MDEEAFIPAAVLVVVVHGFRWGTQAHFDIGIAEDDDTAGDGIALGLHARRLEMTHAHHLGFDVFGLGGIQLLPSRHLSRGMDVIDGGGRAYEAFGAEDFLGVQRSIRATKLDMSLGGKFAELGVVGHGVISGSTIVGLAR